MEFFSKLFDTDDFPARWHCGLWTEGHGWLHILSDLGIWAAYFAIPLVIGYFVLRRKDLPFRSIMLLFAAFIVLCGTTHLMEAIIFWWPAYRLAGLWKLLTAVVSWLTVFALFRTAPAMLSMRSPEELERLVQERTDQLSFILNATGVGMWLNTLPLGQLNWDKRTRELFRVSSGEEPTIELFWSRLHPDDRERTRLAMEAALRDRTVYDIEHRVVDPTSGERRWVRSMGHASYNDAGAPIRFDGLNYDITDRKRLEDELRHVAAELSDANRRKDEFLATLAHELRNPLAPIRNGLQVMKLAEDDAAAVQAARSMMERQLDQMVRLVDDLMDISRISRGRIELRKERVRLADVVNSAVETSRPLIEQMGLQLTVALPEQPVFLEADLTRLAQVLMNLLNNAAKYGERGGRIWLTVERQGSDVVVSVRDGGIGIPADKLTSIFDMFSQVDRSLERSQGGLGIGLALVKRLVVMHGGSVEARSEGPGRGAEFLVRLPILVEASEPRPAQRQEPAAPKSSLRILIVDDNKDGADSLAMMLKMMGNETRTAYDGLEGVEIAGRMRPDVILFDIGLPKLNGYEACRRIREQPWSKGVILVVVTGWGQDEDRRRSQEAGFDLHLLKPADPAALMKLLAELNAAK